MRKLKQLKTDRRGNISIVAAVTLPITIAGLAFGADATAWYLDKSELTLANDAGALSSAYLFNRGMTKADIEAAIKSNFTSQGFPSGSLSVSVTMPSSAAGELVLDSAFNAEKYFADAIYNGFTRITARTRVQLEPGEACVVALNTTAAAAFTMTGSASATLTGCNVASNSTASNAIYLGGASLVTTDCLISAGGISGEQNANTTCARNKTFSRATDDPFSGMTQPATPASCANPPNFKPKDSFTLSPGCFKSDLDIKGTVTFSPGVYILDGVDMSINSNATVTGTDVTFVLKNGATLDFNGSAEIDFKAPTSGSSGTYPGMLFWASSTNGASHKLNGNSSSEFQGAMYFPDDAIEFTGSSGMTTGCMRLIGDTVELKGNADMKANCTTELAGVSLDTAGSAYIVE